MDHPVQLTKALSPVPVWPRRGPQEVSAIHEPARRRSAPASWGAHEYRKSGWEWAGPDLASLAKEYVDAGLSGPELLNAVRSHSSREMTLVALTEQLPDPNNRITPDFNRLDAIGVPKPRVFFRLDDYTASALAAARSMHEQLFHAVGATEIGHLPYAEGAGHIMGTTRMGTDARTSVATAAGQSHDHPNLWFAGASLFPTSGTANPTLTIGACAADRRGDQNCVEAVARRRYPRRVRVPATSVQTRLRQARLRTGWIDEIAQLFAATAAISRLRKPSTALLSIQRTTATRSFSGST